MAEALDGWWLRQTFEIGKAYRNEGSRPEHLQEFTNMEFYWAYTDYRDGMKLVRGRYISKSSMKSLVPPNLKLVATSLI